MTNRIGSIDHFYEVIPGHWIIIGWSILPGLENIILQDSSSQGYSVEICPVRLPRSDVAEAFNDASLKTAGFVAFIDDNDFSNVNSVLFGSHSVACNPIPLSPSNTSWISRFHDLLNLLQIRSLTKADLRQLLLFGLLDLVTKGAKQWNLQQPWKNYGLRRFQLGCRYGQQDMNLVLVTFSAYHQSLFSYLRRLSSDPWCLNGRVRILLICNQSNFPDRLADELHNLIFLKQICIELVIPELEIGLFECINLGIYLANSNLIILDPSLLINRLSCFLQGFLGHGLLEPQRLILTSVGDELSPVCPPLLFSRDVFFEAGALQSLDLDLPSIAPALSRMFESHEVNGALCVKKLPVQALTSVSNAFASTCRENFEGLSIWQSVVNSLLYVS